MSITSLPASISDPKGVMAENVLNPLSVRVSWQAVKYANRYTVTFTKAMESLQEGPCKSYFHTVTLSVDTASVNVSVGQDVGPSNTTMLRAYTTYFITVVAESDVLGTSDGCDHIILTTPQSSKYPKVLCKQSLYVIVVYVLQRPHQKLYSTLLKGLL